MITPNTHRICPAGIFTPQPACGCKGKAPAMGANPGVGANPSMGVISALTTAFPKAGALLCHLCIAHSIAVPNPAVLCFTQVQPDLKLYVFRCFLPHGGGHSHHTMLHSMTLIPQTFPSSYGWVEF